MNRDDVLRQLGFSDEFIDIAKQNNLLHEVDSISTEVLDNNFDEPNEIYDLTIILPASVDRNYFVKI